MLDLSVPLTSEDIFNMASNNEDDINTKINNILIAQAIQATFPTETDIFIEYCHAPHLFSLPVLSPLPHEKMKHYTLGPILSDEGTINGHYKVLNSIFCLQFGLAKHSNLPAGTSCQPQSVINIDWTKQLYLVYGD